MKIMVLATDFKPNLGGIAELAFQICKELAARGHEVDVVTTTAPGREEAEQSGSLRVHRLFPPRPKVSFYSLRGLWSVPAWVRTVRQRTLERIRACRPDVILCTNVKGMWLKVLQKAARPYALFIHGDDLAPMFRQRNPWPRMVLRRLVRGAGWTFFNSHFSRSAVDRGLGGIGSRNSVVGCGLTLDQIVQEDCRPAARRELGWGEEPVLLTVCRLILRKGVDTTLQALPKVRRQFPGCRYVVVGEGRNRGELEKLAENLGLSQAVSFLGHVSEELKRRVYVAADLYVMPSRPGRSGEAEGFGISFLEAHAHGLAVVGSTAGGIPDAVTDGLTGLLVSPGDPEALAGAICRLLGNPRQRQDMVRQGQRQIRERFNWVKIVDAMEPPIQRLAGGSEG